LQRQYMMMRELKNFEKILQFDLEKFKY